MSRLVWLAAGLATVVAGIATIAMAQAGAGDPTRGAAVFDDHCSSCHSIKDNMQGPHLGGVVGRKAASVEGVDYTDALKGSGLVWTADKLDMFLTGPEKMVPGTAMTATVPDAAERRDLIAYLASTSSSAQ
jgi:cytochrome c